MNGEGGDDGVAAIGIGPGISTIAQDGGVVTARMGCVFGKGKRNRVTVSHIRKTFRMGKNDCGRMINSVEKKGGCAGHSRVIVSIREARAPLAGKVSHIWDCRRWQASMMHSTYTSESHHTEIAIQCTLSIPLSGSTASCTSNLCNTYSSTNP